MGNTCNTYEGEKRCIQAFGQEFLKKYASRRHKNRWEDNIKMNLQEVYWGTEGIDLAQD
jgi:hypothetical protein